MASDMEDSNSSWNLSFDDDFDTSSGSFEPRTPPSDSKQVFSNVGFQSYKSSARADHVRANEGYTHQQARTSMVERSPAETKSQTSPSRSVLGHARSSNIPAQPPIRSASRSKAPSPHSRHRQAKSMIYASSPGQKWQGPSIDTSFTSYSSSSSSPRKISPHNSPLMSSFAKAQDHQERLSAGTLSGLVLRFLRSKSVSSLALRIISFIIVLLLTTLVVNRSNKQISHFSSTAPPSMILGTLDDDANLLAARALLQLNESARDYVPEQASEVDDHDVGTERWIQEERRIAHSRAAKARLRNHDSRKEVADSPSDALIPLMPVPIDTLEYKNEDSAVQQPKQQRLFTKLRTNEAIVEDQSLEKGPVPKLSLPVEEDDESSASRLEAYAVSEEAAAELGVSLEEELESTLEDRYEQDEELEEELKKEQTPVMWRKGGPVRDHGVEVHEDVVEERRQGKERGALLEQLQAARQQAQLEFGEIQAEREHAVHQPVSPADEESEYEFLQVEVDEKEVVRPGDLQQDGLEAETDS